MSERGDLLVSIANTTADYRTAELAAPTPGHVETWVLQFDGDVQLPILREMDHVLKKTYFSRKRMTEFLRGLLHTEKLAGSDPRGLWNNVQFLDIQDEGNSQREMLALFSNLLEEECGYDIADCGQNPELCLYLDDGVFTGNRVRRDLEKWIRSEAPAEAIVHVVSIALHRGGHYYANGRISEAANAANKDIELKWWHAIEFEDRRYYTDVSDVLRPTCIPEDEAVERFVDGMGYEPHLRTAGSIGRNKFFSSDASRQLLEQEFLITGARIRELCPNLGDTQRPLGHMTLDTLGFGSLIVTFRNCPNNTPLALWVGDPWYPLFPRVTNNESAFKQFLAMLDKDEA